jgi:hypothetical protein
MSVTQGGRTDFNGTVSVNNFASANASACLDLTSTTQGALLPRMTTTQQNNISTPATGLTIYNTSTNLLSTYNGTVWQSGPVLISKQVLAGAVPTVTFSAIPQTYTHLQLWVVGRVSDVVGTSRFYIQFNGDTGNNYNWNLIVNNTLQTGGPVAIINLGDMAGASATANCPTSCVINIPNYAGTVFNKQITGTTCAVGNVASEVPAGVWFNTAAITSITISQQNVGNFIIGSTFSLYGIP